MGTFEGSLTVSVEPITLPVTIAEVKDHLNIDYDDHDFLLWSQINAAVAMVESETSRDIAERTRIWKFDDLAGDAIALPRGPVRSITSIQYVDADGNTQTFSSGSYSLDPDHLPPVIRLGYNQTWPSVRGDQNAVTVTFVTGYAGTADSPTDLYQIPEALKAAIKLIVGDMYNNKEAQTVIPGQAFQVNRTVQRLLDPYRIFYCF